MKNILCKTTEVLKESKTILYPTDTVWGIGCDATNSDAVSKIYTIKQRNESKSLVVLVDSFEMLQQYVDTIPTLVKKILSKNKNPTTIIYNNPKNLAKNVIAKDNTVAIRIVKDKFCQELIQEFGKPIVSTSANISGNPTPKSFKEIEPSILESVDYVVNLHQNRINKKPSKIIKLEVDGSIKIIRD
ncbi:MAG: threonylcarbamoyl-AMP synthase [Flavobacteriaceae bacterium]|nr:threonylcarbamoyl-AMP synthase [Flavobacteriaceae bacterium]